MPDAEDAPAGFEWDAEKARANLVKHGVSFHEAARVWNDPDHLIASDVKHSRDEVREFAIGRVEGVVLTVRYTPRGDNTRIIGVGPWRMGRKLYAGR